MAERTAALPKIRIRGLTKSFGSNNPKNLVKAVVDGLGQLRSKELIESLRGCEIGHTLVEEMIHRGEAFMAVPPSDEEAATADEETPADETATDSTATAENN